MQDAAALRQRIEGILTLHAPQHSPPAHKDRLSRFGVTTLQTNCPKACRDAIREPHLAFSVLLPGSAVRFEDCGEHNVLMLHLRRRGVGSAASSGKPPPGNALLEADHWIRESASHNARQPLGAFPRCSSSIDLHSGLAPPERLPTTMICHLSLGPSSINGGNGRSTQSQTQAQHDAAFYHAR
jgi:hypothetical protein